MYYKIFVLIFSFFFLSVSAFAEEAKIQTKKSLEENKKKNEELKKSSDQKKQANQKKNTQKKSTKKKPNYYHKAKKPVILGQEKYQKIYKSLKGLKSVYINLDSYLKGSKSRKMKMSFDVKKKVRAILKKHNIHLVDKNSIKWKYGQPTINISASFPAFLGPYKKGEKKKKPGSCCRASVSASLTEGAKLLRYPDLNIQLTTWKTSEGTADCVKLDDWFPKAVIKVVEKFVSDKVKAEKKDTPKKVVKKPVIKKTVAKHATKKVVKKPEVKKIVKKVVETQKVVKPKSNYSSQGGLSHIAPSKKTVVTKKVEQVTEKAVSAKKFVPVITQPVVTQKELVCANSTPNLVTGDEFYRKVVTYQRVAPQEQMVNYELVSPQKTIVVQQVQESMGCSKNITMNMEIFRTGSSHIIPSKYFMLDTLVNKINSCPNYRYIIETHADQRGSHAYNDKLTKDRADSISVYLQSRGISTKRFKLKSFGKRRPVNFGTSVDEYSENRRVVMIPHSINK